MILLLFVACLVMIIWHCWHQYSALLRFPCYFWIYFDVFHWVFLSKKRETFGTFFFQKVLSVCKKFENDGMVVMWPLFAPPWLFVYSEETVKFFSKDEKMITKPHFYEFFLNSKKNNSSLIASSGEKWKKERKLVAPAFRAGLVKEMVPAMNRHAKDLVRDLSRFGGETIEDTSDLLKANAIRLFHESAMGLKEGKEVSNEKARQWMEITERMTEIVSLRMSRPWLHFDLLWNMSSLSKEQEKLYEDMTCLMTDIILQLKEKAISKNRSKTVPEGNEEESDSPKCGTFSEALMEMHLQDPSFTIDDLIAQLFTVVSAGFDTSSITLTRALWLLGLHPDVQETAFKEITTETGQSVTFEDARKLSFLECIINESLRLYPAIPMYARRSNREIHFGKYRIPENTSIVFVPYALHRNPDFYPDPEVFNPDRFRSDTSNKSTWIFLPFAEGTRACIGKNYAMLQMKIFLTHVLRKFKIVSLDHREDVTDTWEIMLRPSKLIRLKFVPR